MLDTKALEKRVAELPPLSDEQIDKGVEKIVNCLEAMDKDGEEGLQRELDKIFGPESAKPQSRFIREKLPPPFTDSYAWRLRKPGE